MNGNNLYNQATDRPYSGDLLLKYTNGTTLARTTIDNRGNFTFSLPAYMPNTAFRIVLADGVSVMATIQTDQYGVGTAWLALPPPYIAGTLWIDANDDGTYNSGTDQTLANEQVQLIFPDSGIIYATLTTSANGTWYVDPATHGSIPLQTVAVILSTGSILKNFTTDAKGSAFVPGPVPPATISLRVVSLTRKDKTVRI